MNKLKTFSLLPLTFALLLSFAFYRAAPGFAQGQTDSYTSNPELPVTLNQTDDTYLLDMVIDELGGKSTDGTYTLMSGYHLLESEDESLPVVSSSPVPENVQDDDTCADCHPSPVASPQPIVRYANALQPDQNEDVETGERTNDPTIAVTTGAVDGQMAGSCSGSGNRYPWCYIFLILAVILAAACLDQSYRRRSLREQIRVLSKTAIWNQKLFDESDQRSWKKWFLQAGLPTILIVLLALLLAWLLRIKYCL
jgi:hypothetical protein